jgi:beta-galactosidase/beta-glucuronidase
VVAPSRVASPRPLDSLRETHPRPQFVRKDWIDLTGTWRFDGDREDRGIDEEWFADGRALSGEIVVPYPPESLASGVGDQAHWTVVWYERDVELPPRDDGGRWLLHFGAVDYRAQVWIDGELSAEHEGGHTPFRVQLPARSEGRTVRITVRAEDRSDDLTQPRGKQDWQDDPHAIWYSRTTGIWQPVWLERVPRTNIERIIWSPRIEHATLRAQLEFNRPVPDGTPLRIVLTVGDRKLAHQTTAVSGPRATVDIAIAALAHDQDLHWALWSPSHPTLVDAEVTLGDGAEADLMLSYIGLRSVEAADGRFLLNRHPAILRMALHQGFWPNSHLAASGDELRREVELAKELGLNGLRIHQKIEDPRFLYWCDRLGVMLWGEMPSSYTYSPTMVQRVMAEWTEVLQRDISAPSIVAWVPLNESWGVRWIADRAEQRHFAQSLYHLTHAFDGSRPVIANDGWEHTATDILGIHDYAPEGGFLEDRYASAASESVSGWGPHEMRLFVGDHSHVGQPVMITEFGGISFHPAEGENWYGYSAVTDARSFAAKVDELVRPLLANPAIIGFCWTQLTDTLQETNGLLDEHRRPKVDPAVLREIFNRPAAANPSEYVAASRRAARKVVPGIPAEATKTDEDTPGVG